MGRYVISIISVFTISICYWSVLLQYVNNLKSVEPIAYVVVGLLTLVYLICVWFCVRLYSDAREHEIINNRRR